jgi:hypothetical protein
MIKKCFEFIKGFKNYFSHDKCFMTMQEQGVANSEVCKGLAGGSRSTGYLQEGCVSCPYFEGL